jgi:nicotinamide riboside transporter PnuC
LDFKELILTVFAIVGTVFLANKNHIIREYAFILFILSDIGFVYLFFSNNLIFMTMQYAFYLITSGVALYRNEGYLYNLMRNSFRSYARAVLDCYVH